MGRIAALLGYCYHLCRKFLQQKAGAFTLVSFLGMVGTWLVKFLIQARFYDWLKQKGGWVSGDVSVWQRERGKRTGVSSCIPFPDLPSKAKRWAGIIRHNSSPPPTPHSQGQLLMTPVTSGITRVQNTLGIHTFLVMGVASLAIWGYYMLKK